MICPNCSKPTTNHYKGKPSPCNGCIEVMQQQSADHQADRSARFGTAPKRKPDIGQALQNHTLKNRHRHRHPSDIDRKPER